MNIMQPFNSFLRPYHPYLSKTLDRFKRLRSSQSLFQQASLGFCFLVVVLVSCSKSPASPGPVPPPPNPVPSANAKLLTLPAGWKYSVNLSNGFPDGVEAYTFDTLFNANTVKAFALAFNPKNALLDFKPVLSSTAKKPSEFFASEQGTVYACINGGFFGGNQSYSLVQYNGLVLSANIKSVNRPYNGSSTAYFPTRAAFGITTTGDPKAAWVYHVGSGNDLVYQYPAPSANKLGEAPQPQATALFPADGSVWQMAAAIGGAPMLLKEGSLSISDAQELIDINNASSRPRSAIGHTATGLVVLLAVEGDNPSQGYPGINLVNLANMLKALGCTAAINLDGGGSTGLIINNRLTVRPGDNGVERVVPSAILIKRK